MPRRRHMWDPICDWPRVVVPVPVDPDGITGPTRGQARGRRWRQTSRGLYVPAEVRSTLPEQRIVEKAMLLPPAGAMTGWGSLRVWGGNFFDGLLADRRTEIPVTLCVGPLQHRREQPGVRFSRDRLDPAETIVRYGLSITREKRALFDEMRSAPDTREAVVAMDMAAAAELTSVRRMRKYIGPRQGWNGVPRVRTALDFASEHSRSPNETRMRLIWRLDAGFPEPLVNQPVWDLNGRLLGFADILDPVAGVVGEFDGADHRGARRHSKDVDRESGFRNCELEFFRVTGLDIPQRHVVSKRMTSARSRAKWLPEGQRPWTITPPVGWQHEPSLDEVLDGTGVATGVVRAASLGSLRMLRVTARCRRNRLRTAAWLIHPGARGQQVANSTGPGDRSLSRDDSDVSPVGSRASTTVLPVDRADAISNRSENMPPCPTASPDARSVRGRRFRSAWSALSKFIPTTRLRSR